MYGYAFHGISETYYACTRTVAAPKAHQQNVGKSTGSNQVRRIAEATETIAGKVRENVGKS